MEVEEFSHTFKENLHQYSSNYTEKYKMKDHIKLGL